MTPVSEGLMPAMVLDAPVKVPEEVAAPGIGGADHGNAVAKDDIGHIHGRCRSVNRQFRCNSHSTSPSIPRRVPPIEAAKLAKIMRPGPDFARFAADRPGPDNFDINCRRDERWACMGQNRGAGVCCCLWAFNHRLCPLPEAQNKKRPPRGPLFVPGNRQAAARRCITFSGSEAPPRGASGCGALLDNPTGLPRSSIPGTGRKSRCAGRCPCLSG